MIVALVTLFSSYHTRKVDNTLNLYSIFKDLDNIFSQSSTMVQKQRMFNALLYCSALHVAGQIDTKMAVSLLGHMYIHNYDQLLAASEFEYNGKSLSGKDLLNMPQHLSMKRTRTSFFDQLCASNEESS